MAGARSLRAVSLEWTARAAQVRDAAAAAAAEAPEAQHRVTTEEEAAAPVAMQNRLHRRYSISRRRKARIFRPHTPIQLAAAAQRGLAEATRVVAAQAAAS